VGWGSVGAGNSYGAGWANFHWPTALRPAVLRAEGLGWGELLAQCVLSSSQALEPSLAVSVSCLGVKKKICPPKLESPSSRGGSVLSSELRENLGKRTRMPCLVGALLKGVLLWGFSSGVTPRREHSSGRTLLRGHFLEADDLHRGALQGASLRGSTPQGEH
jgi:hypothetical protein